MGPKRKESLEAQGGGQAAMHALASRNKRRRGVDRKQAGGPCYVEQTRTRSRWYAEPNIANISEKKNREHHSQTV